MTSPLLKTKLHIPPTRPNLVARPRLIARMNESLTRPLTLVSAPPGFGKTTVVTAWLEQQPLPAAWYSLDERDNDLGRFLTYLVAALETVEPEVGRQALNQLRARRRPPLESVMTLLSNDIAEMSREFILVLDDYHMIELQAIHEAMEFLLDVIPAPMHLVVTTRADPPFRLTRLRARGQLLELRAPDLRFSSGEAATFLNERMGLDLTPDQVAALEARTEGWIAGLQLAALSMQERQDVAGFIHAFTGSHHFVLDYLAEEALQRQAPEIQTFLLQTSILDQVNAALADAVTERKDSAQVLAHLDKSNLFIVPLDDARQWYRYHHLFEDLLQGRLQQTHPEQMPELHRRASAWFEQNGFMNEAVDHALAAPDFERAARLIEHVGLVLILRSEITTLSRWIAQLPDSLVRGRPFLHLIYAASLMMAGELTAGAAHLAQVEDAELDPQARRMAGILRSADALLRSDMSHAMEAARQTLAEAEASSIDPSSPQAELNAIATLFTAVVLAELQIAAGQLRAAAATCRHALELSKSISAGELSELVLGYIHYTLAEISYEWNDMATGERHATQSLEVCQRVGNEEIKAYALITLAQIKQAQGDSANAFDMLQQVSQLERKRNIASEMRYVAARQVKLLLAQGRIDAAVQLVSELPTEGEIAWFIERGLTVIARARVLIAQQDFGQAADLLKDSNQAEGGSQTTRPVEALALLALARRGQGDAAQAAATLTHVLSLAAPEGYVRTFVDLGEPMRQEIRDWRLRSTPKGFEIGADPENHALAEYADKLLASFPVAPLQTNLRSPISRSEAETPRTLRGNLQSPISNLQSPVLAEPLSERELAVLRLIAEGLSNQEIADRLVVAVSTVKTHINNIYGKLGVGTRTQALARARELNLL